ncbi:ankyrin repeat domain-containing protein [Actinoplanes sp. NPDC026623]|uniref:ankyrin repeat domain-containing protein n=1 Tax=Actinoplanes sp. NPDC026623 TaxID=3155610 RepID=UPI0033F95B0D
MNRRRRKKLQQRLTEAAGRADVSRVAGLLLDGADPNLPDPGGSTPLYRASVQNLAGNVRALVAAGADPNRESGAGDEGLPLCGAACWGHADAVRELLAAGADPNRREDQGHGPTAAEWAALGDHRDTLELLLTADPSPAPPPSRTAPV